jgi:hypothetical protein
MNFVISFGLLLGLLVLPILVSGCLPDGRGGEPWYEARRDATGLAPDPASTPEAVVQIYAARAVSWRGVFAVHTWLALKPAGADRYTGTRYSASASPMAPRRFVSTAWAQTITGLEPGRRSCSIGADLVSMQ